MRSIWLLLLILSLPHLLPAQTLNGKVILGPKETDPPLGGVRVEVPNFTTQTSDPETGTFSLNLPGVQPGTKVPLDITKPNYAVINREATQPYLANNPLERTLIHMAPAGQRSEMALTYYRISVERNIQVNFDAAAKRFADEANYSAIAKLYEEKETALKLADSLAARLSRFDPQTASDEPTRAMQLYQDGQVKQALEVLDADKIAARIAARKDILAEMQAANEQDIQTLLQAAEMAISDFQFDKATAYYQAAIDADTTNVGNLWDFAYYLQDQNQNQRAMRLYEQALRQARDINTRANLLNNLGNAYSAQNRDEEAITAYEQALAIRAKLVEKNSQFEYDLANTLNNLGNSYSDLNRYKEAISAYEEALLIRRQLAQRDSQRFKSDVAMTLNNMGLVYADLNRYSEAIPAYEETLDIYSRLAQQNPQRFKPDVAMILNNLGTTYSDLNRHEEAITIYAQTLETYRELAQQNPQRFEPDVSMVLNNLGLGYADRGRYLEAISAHEEALEIRRRLAKENPQRFEADLAQTFNNLGISYHQLNRYEAAISAYDQAYEIYRRLAQQNPMQFDPDQASILNNLGNAYDDLDRYEAAISAYHQALDIFRRLTQQNPQRFESDLAQVLNNLGVSYNSLSRHEVAISTFDQALDIYRRLAQQNPQRFEPKLATTLNNLGGVYSDLNRYKAAIVAYDQALAIIKGLATQNPTAFGASLGDSHYDLGLLYRRQNLFDQAIHSFQEADSAYQLSLSSEQSEKGSVYARYWIAKLAEVDIYPKTLDERGVDFYQEGKNDSALSYFQRAVAGYEKIPHDSLTTQALYNASFAYTHLNLFEEDQQRRYQYQKQAAEYKEQVFAAVPSDSSVQANLASSHYNLSWYALFVEAYEEAEASARRSLELAPEETGVISNLAAALLLQGKYEQAKQYYLDYADQPWPDDRYETFRPAFLADLTELEAAGITHPDIAKIRALLSE